MALTKSIVSDKGQESPAAYARITEYGPDRKKKSYHACMSVYHTSALAGTQPDKPISDYCILYAEQSVYSAGDARLQAKEDARALQEQRVQQSAEDVLAAQEGRTSKVMSVKPSVIAPYAGPTYESLRASADPVADIYIDQKTCDQWIGWMDA